MASKFFLIVLPALRGPIQTKTVSEWRRMIASTRHEKMARQRKEIKSKKKVTGIVGLKSHPPLNLG